jgi:hypothetical protein
VAVAAIFTALRTWLQYRHNQCLYINDILILAALMFLIVTSILYQLASPLMFELEAMTGGYEVPTPTLIDRLDMFLRLFFAITYIFYAMLWTVKLALLFFFWRLFQSVQSHMRLFWWFMVFLVFSTWTISLFLTAFACNPPSGFFFAGVCFPPS